MGAITRVARGGAVVGLKVGVRAMVISLAFQVTVR